MQTLPVAVQKLLKSRSMIGDNKPTSEVLIQNQPHSTISDRELTLGVDGDGIAVVVAQGYLTNNPKNMSNYVPTKDGRFMTSWTEDGKVMLGFCSDEGFLDQPYYLSSITATSISITVMATDSQTSLFRRSDGKILLFVAHCGTYDTDTKADVYISHTGNGDDFEHLSNLYTGAAVATSYDFQLVKAQIKIPIEIQLSGGGTRLLVNFAVPYRRTSPVFGTQKIGDRLSIYASDDQGETWSEVAYHTSSMLNEIGQMCQIKDGTVYFEWHTSTGGQILMKYIPTTGTVTNIGDWQTFKGSYCWNASLYYDSVADVVYRVSARKDLSSQIFKLEQPTQDNFFNIDSWDVIAPLDGVQSFSPHIFELPSKRIGIILNYGRTDYQSVAVGLNALPSDSIDITSISIDRTTGMAAQANITIDNTNGFYSPDKVGDWKGIIMPNREVTIKQGYGENLVQTFVGYIDSVSMSTFPATLTISCRDKSKLALDRIVTNDVDGGHYVKFSNAKVEDIFVTLAGLCGLTTGTIGVSGITLANKMFSWESYADAFSWLADIASFEWYVDELGIIHFVRDEMPASPTVVYEFSEGEDIISLGYTISDDGLYYSATVYGTDANDKAIRATANFGAPVSYNLFSQKALKIDAPDAKTVAQCQEIANRAVALMVCRARVVNFAAIGVPWLQIGDFIRVTERSSSISEVYRITNLSSSQDDSGFTMQITCYWYGEV